MERHELERMNQLASKVAHLEQQLVAVYRHLGLTYQDASPVDDVVALIRSGHKIEAIRMYGEKNKVGLAEAKTAVDEMAKKLGLG